MTRYTAPEISRALHQLANPAIARHSLRFFKTGPGEYGEGDIFLGIRVPVIRQQVRTFCDTDPDEIEKLLASPFHEERLTALLLLVEHFRKGDGATRDAIYRRYLENTRFINNWDLVDCSAPLIVGPYLADKPRHPLYDLTVTSSLWERRIAIIATFHFIKKGDFHDALAISQLLLGDKEDLIHKAVGWMLREIGKRDPETEHTFLRRRCRTMPRTMLRYAIERFPPELRKDYLEGRVEARWNP